MSHSERFHRGLVSLPGGRSAALRATPIRRSEAGGRRVVLGEVAALVRELEVVVAPSGLGHPVEKIVLDPLATPFGANDLVFVLSPSRVALAGALALGGANGCAAVAGLTSVIDDQIITLAGRCGIALLSVEGDPVRAVAAAQQALCGPPSPNHADQPGPSRVDERALTLRLLLDARMPGAVATTALDLPAGRFAVLAVEAPEETVVGICRHAEMHGAHPHRPLRAAQVGERVYVLERLPLAGDERPFDWVDGFVAPESGEVCAAVSNVVEDPSDIARSRREADQVLGLMRQRGWTGIGQASELGGQLLLSEFASWLSVRGMPGSPAIDALLAHDRDNGTDYVRTLWMYLRAGGDTHVAAQWLHIHRNTLRYRIRRLIEICGIRLDDPDDRLVAELQLCLRHQTTA